MSLLAIFMVWLMFTIVAAFCAMFDFVIAYHTVLYYAPVSYLVNNIFTELGPDPVMIVSLSISIFISIMIVKDDNIIKLKSKLFKEEWYETAITYGIFVSFLIFLSVK